MRRKRLRHEDEVRPDDLFCVPGSSPAFPYLSFIGQSAVFRGLRGGIPTDTHIKYVFVDVRPLRRFAPPPLQGGGVYFATPSYSHCCVCRWPVLRLCGRNAAPPAKIRMSRNTCENRQIVLFWLIFVTRLLRNPPQIADFRAIFFAQNGAFVQVFVRVVYFFGSPAGNFGAGTRNSEPRNSFFGAWNFYFGARMEKSRYRNLFAAASGVFFFPVGTFSRTYFPHHFVGGIPRRAFPPVGFLRRKCPLFRDFRKARVAAFFPRRPGPAAEYANLRRRK